MTIRADKVTCSLALHFHQPVQFVKIVGIPLWRHDPHQDSETFYKIGTVRNESCALCNAKNVTIDDENAFPEIAEIQRRAGHFRPGAGEALQPVHGWIDRPVGKKG